MLAQCRLAAPGAALVEGDLELLPFGPRVLGGGWANMSYLHVPRPRLPLALAELHRVLQVGSPVDLQVLAGDYEGDALPHDDVGGRFSPVAARGAARRARRGGLRPRLPGDRVARETQGACPLPWPTWGTRGAGRATSCGRSQPQRLLRPGWGGVRPARQPVLALCLGAGVAHKDRTRSTRYAGGVGITDLVKRAHRRRGEG